MGIRKEGFADLKSEEQDALVRERMFRVLGDEEFLKALEKMMDSRFSRMQEQIDSLQKAIVKLEGAAGALIPRPAGVADPDPAYKLLRWREGAIVKAAGKEVTEADTTIDQDVQDDWHTNPMPRE